MNYLLERGRTLQFNCTSLHKSSNITGEYVDNDGDIVHFGIDSDYGCEVFSLWYVSGADAGYNFFHGECDYWDEDKMLVTEYFDNEGNVLE